MAAHPEHSIPRTRAVNATRRYYPASEFEKESLARVAEAGVSASLDQKDKLLGAIYKMFSAYGNAQLNQESAVLNRIKLCARLRLPGRLGYHKFDEAAKACRHMHILSDHYRNMADGILYDRSATPPPLLTGKTARSGKQIQRKLQTVTRKRLFDRWRQRRILPDCRKRNHQMYRGRTPRH